MMNEQKQTKKKVGQDVKTKRKKKKVRRWKMMMTMTTTMGGNGGRRRRRRRRGGGLAMDAVKWRVNASGKHVSALKGQGHHGNHVVEVPCCARTHISSAI